VASRQLLPKGASVPLRYLDRYAYLPPERRSPITWPNGARVAFWVVPNIEFYELHAPRGSAWPRPEPDVFHYSSRDYGNRVGVWRVFDVLDEFDVRASVSLNAGVCERLPEIADACVARGWELFSHGVYNTQRISGLTESEVDVVIGESVRLIAERSGSPVRGFLAPALSATETMFDLLPRHGIWYTVDLVPDDRPVPILTRDASRLIALPYSAELNDVRMMHYRGYSAEAFAAMVKAAFDQLHEEGGESGSVLCLPLHPFVIGQPHRISALREILRHLKGAGGVWFATGSEIAQWYYDRCYDADIAASQQTVVA
jgi:peptidoglycan/xylan/chitin deacetylase (PgdA/CDA1 family)